MSNWTVQRYKDTLGTLCSFLMLHFLLTILRVSPWLYCVRGRRCRQRDMVNVQDQDTNGDTQILRHACKTILNTVYRRANEKMYWRFTVTHNRNVPILQQLACISLITHRSSQETPPHANVTQTLHFPHSLPQGSSPQPMVQNSTQLRASPCNDHMSRSSSSSSSSVRLRFCRAFTTTEAASMNINRLNHRLLTLR